MKLKSSYLVLILILAITTAGCFGKKKAEKLAPELAAEGVKYYQDEKYDKAIKSFNQLKDWYPFDKLSILAEFKIAEAYFKMDEYEDAVISYELFETLHPRNESIPYTIFQIGMCYYLRIDTIDRDQKNTLMAIKTFRRLIRQHPDNEYAKKAADHIQTCLKSLAGHELYVGNFYMKAKHYDAAKKRFETILAVYPDLGFDEQAKKAIKKCNALMKNYDKTKEHKDGLLYKLFSS
jgi:outer membrane protein assembly factor BamD